MYKKDLNFIIETFKGNKVNYDIKDWYTCLGFLVANKTAAKFLNQCRKLKIKIPKLIYTTLNNVFLYQKAKVSILRKFIEKISSLLESQHINHAFLKGSILSNCLLNDEKVLYVIGERVSNDIDLLIDQKDITKVEKTLKKLNFIQGYYDYNKNKIIPFTRKEIILRRLNRGETAPWILKISNHVVPFIEVDINFSLKEVANDSELTKAMLSSTICYKTNKGNYIRSLEYYDFIIQLILHAYKELTLTFMVENNKDIQLYKFLDLYLLLTKRVDLEILLNKCRQYKLEYEAYIIFNALYDIFHEESFKYFTYNFDFNQQNYVLKDYVNKKEYTFDLNIRERLLNFSNIKYLIERNNNE